MTTQQSNNIKISKFMGRDPGELEPGQEVYLRYHESLDELMPVVEKIRGMGFNFSIVSSKIDWSVYIIGEDGNLNFPYYSKLVDAIYTACVQFIDWFNNQKQEINK